jgi:hypothetical protein
MEERPPMYYYRPCTHAAWGTTHVFCVEFFDYP